MGGAGIDGDEDDHNRDARLERAHKAAAAALSTRALERYGSDGALQE